MDNPKTTGNIGYPGRRQTTQITQDRKLKWLATSTPPKNVRCEPRWLWSVGSQTWGVNPGGCEV
jgi:hypothetical protein